MRTARNRTGLSGVLCLVLALALQLALSGLGLGAAAAVPLDSFGNPICHSGSTPADNAAGGGRHGEVEACCQLGCPAAAGAALAPPDASGVEAPNPVSLGSGRLRFAASVPLGQALWRPWNPRGPPGRS